MPLIGAGTQYGFADDGNSRGSHDRAADYTALALKTGFRMLDTARSLIVKEIAIARDQTEEDVKNEIESIFFTN